MECIKEIKDTDEGIGKPMPEKQRDYKNRADLNNKEQEEIQYID